MPEKHDYEAPISLDRHDICRALREVGLGPKLINAALVELGFKLKPFPKPPWEGAEENEPALAQSEKSKNQPTKK